MNDKKLRQPFKELSLPRKELPKLTGYRVYKDVGDYIVVQADNAAEALKQSGLSQVYRIEQDSIFLNTVLNLKALAETPPPTAAAPPEPVSAPPAEAAAPAAAEAPAPVAPEAAPAAAPPAADASGLSAAEVDKLLQGQ